MSRPPTAHTVVYREAQYRFDVDGEPFPWLITEDGARFTQDPTGAVLVGVTILVLDPDREPAEFHHAPGSQPLIAGREFPWAMTGPTVYTYGHHVGVGLLSLTFVAETVDTDTELLPSAEPS